MRVGIHVMVLYSGVEASDFEQVMVDDVFPRAAVTPGTVNRGGMSAIKSQHLLRSEEEKGKYWWLVKDSGALSSRTTGEIIQKMYETVRDKLDTLAIIESSTSFDVTNSFEIGERDLLGRPVGLPTSGSEL
jgi:hypothetical protein